MTEKWQPIYPSSKVPEKVKYDYGWRLAEEIPARIHPTSGQIVPTREASDYLRELRRVIDERPTVKLQTESKVIEIEDFAVAYVPHQYTGLKLGFFVLLPKDVSGR